MTTDHPVQKRPVPQGMLPLRHRIVVRRFAGTRSHHEAIETPIRIAHLTDQHVGRATARAVQQLAIERVNAQHPDLVMLTGDYVGYGLDYVDEVEELLRQLQAPAIGVLGNHDHWAGADHLRRALRRAGIAVLDNASTVVQVRGQALQVVGLDDGYTGHADVRRAVRGIDPRLPTIGLSHLPEEADALWDAGVSLVLAGHTHSGQVTLGGVNRLTMGAFGSHRYIHGLYGCRHGLRAPGAVYVSAGIGASRIDLRLGERGRREIAVFELGERPGAFPEHHAEQRPSGRMRAAARRHIAVGRHGSRNVA